MPVKFRIQCLAHGQLIVVTITPPTFSTLGELGSLLFRNLQCPTFVACSIPALPVLSPLSTPHVPDSAAKVSTGAPVFPPLGFCIGCSILHKAQLKNHLLPDAFSDPIPLEGGGPPGAQNTLPHLSWHHQHFYPNR